MKCSVAEKFTKHAGLYLQRTVWSGLCNSCFKAGQKGSNPDLWPGSRIHNIQVLQKPRFDYKFEYLSGNAFNFLGGGFDVREEVRLSSEFQS
jgi:hypothetical protein